MADITVKEEIGKKLVELLSPDNVAKIVLGTDADGKQRSIMDMIEKKKKKKRKTAGDLYKESVKKKKKSKKKKKKRNKKNKEKNDIENLIMGGKKW